MKKPIENRYMDRSSNRKENRRVIVILNNNYFLYPEDERIGVPLLDQSEMEKFVFGNCSILLSEAEQFEAIYIEGGIARIQSFVGWYLGRKDGLSGLTLFLAQEDMRQDICY